MHGFKHIDHLLRNREQVVNDLQDGDKVREVTRISFFVFAALSAAYGLIMGSQSLFHGYGSGWLYSIAAAVKLPLLFLFTLAICMPLFYVLNVLIGPRSHWRVIFGIHIASLAVTSILLASCALILAFFMLSTKSYAFITLLNVTIFTLAGLYGVWFLSKAMYALPPVEDTAEPKPKNNIKTIITWWIITYGIVGSQMAWIMRPFIGMPGAPFSLFRPQESNFAMAVGNAIAKLLGF